MTSGAIIRGRYRFALWRKWGRGEIVNFVMLNPSKADEKTNDPTVKKCIGFAKTWGFGSVLITNLFPIRSTDPTRLREPGAFSRFNTGYVRMGVEASQCVVLAWGASVEFALERDVALSSLASVLSEHSARPLCLGVTNNGHPRHPVRLAYATMIEEWQGYADDEWAFLKGRTRNGAA